MHTVVRAAGSVTVKVYNVIERAVEEGVTHGWNRAHKHTASPDQFSLCEHIVEGVMSELSEVLTYPSVLE
jgi:hypothetical protein